MYDQINVGMSIVQVEEIMGGPGSSEMNAGGEFMGQRHDILTYSWTNDNPMSLKVISVIFENGRVSSKTHIGL